MQFPYWYTLSPHVSLRERLRILEGELSLLGHWSQDAATWRERLTETLAGLLGFPPPEYGGDPWNPVPGRCPLGVRELEWVECPDHARIRVQYNTEPQVAASAWALVPFAIEEPRPAVVIAHDRASSKDELAGLYGDPDQSPALSAVRAGYVVLIPDARGHGERAGDEESLALVGSLMGRPLVGQQGWDLTRAVEVLAGRPDVEPRRIGLVGLGTGAVHALFAAALDPAPACVALAGGLGTWREWLVRRDCLRNQTKPLDVLPGLLRYADLDDVACLLPPRALLLLRAAGETDMPAAAFDDLVTRTRAGYEVLGERFRLETETLEACDHALPARVAQFLDDWLKLPLQPSEGAEPPAEGNPS